MEEKILQVFLYNHKLKFSEIEKQVNVRSNKLAYHIEKMVKEGLLEKRGKHYFLTKNAEKYLPILSNLIGKDMSPLPIILVALMNDNKILLIKRNRRPYKDYWSLIGGKMLLKEDFKQASLRQIKEKTGIEGKYISINSVLHERIRGEGIIKHSFILFFTKVKTKKLNFKETLHGKLKWFDVRKIKKNKIIPSDLWLIKNKLDSEIDVKNATMLEKEGKLSHFKL